MESFRIGSAKNGLGVFATKIFHKHERIVELTGNLITCGVNDDLDARTRDNAIRFDEDVYLSSNGGVGDFFNHSCNPNAFIQKKGRKLFITARRKIASGKEICFDYSTITAADDIWQMRCRCGSAKCRHTVRQFAELPKKMRHTYQQEGVVPEYITSL